MVICTQKASAILTRALGRGQSSVIAIDKMLDQFSIDPNITSPKRDAYVVTDEDIKATKVKKKFEEAAASKHAATKIIFINRGKKPAYPNGLEGVDIFVNDAKIPEVTAAISSVLQGNQIAEVVEEATTESVMIDKYDPREAAPENYFTEAPVEQPEYVPQMDLDITEPPVEEATIEEVAPEPISRNPMAERIAATRGVNEASYIMREITATNLIKELYESNSTYAGIEEKLTGVRDMIHLVLADTTIASLDEKLSRIQSLNHDKAFFVAKGDTLIEQRLEEVIDLLCNHVGSLLDSRLAEIDFAIKQIQQQKIADSGNARLGGLNEERVNIILELRTFETEIQILFKQCDILIKDVVGAIAERSNDITGSEIYNAHMRNRGTVLISDETKTAIYSAINLSSTTVPEAFKEMKLKIVNMIGLLSRLFDLDAEIIAAQQQLIDYMKANKIEDTVVAETLLKKSLRVYMGYEGSGRTIIPYLLSAYKSRQNANVLLLDLTGQGKWDDYGIQTTDVEDYLLNLHQKEFCVVAGRIENTMTNAQRIIVALLKAADYYRVINVVMRPDQRELFETIASDVLSVNYIVDTTPQNLEKMKSLIATTKVRNVARRVIVNQCNVPTRPIVSRLGLDDSIEFQLCVFPSLEAITDASLNNYNPYGLSAVTIHMEELIKHA